MIDLLDGVLLLALLATQRHVVQILARLSYDVSTMTACRMF